MEFISHSDEALLKKMDLESPLPPPEADLVMASTSTALNRSPDCPDPVGSDLLLGC